MRVDPLLDSMTSAIHVENIARVLNHSVRKDQIWGGAICLLNVITMSQITCRTGGSYVHVHVHTV